jgi:2-keto-4-pentenoate hydratase/2-oxohepta-3-ene-1,7-dioic acid hydratase in catechol pathway
MRLYTFEADNQTYVGIEVEGNFLADITPAEGRRDILSIIESYPAYTAARKGKPYPISEVKLKAPYRNPQKIICIGQNYLDHCREQNVPPPPNPILFAKYATAIIGPNEGIVHPRETSKLDFEAELAVIIGARGRRIPRDQAYNYVFGYSIMHDVSARDIQHGDKQWVRGKSFDTFAPFGPCLVTKDEIPDPHTLSIKTWLNDELMQNSNTGEMIFKIPELIEFISNCITLEPGDIISTGTPFGVGVFRNPPVFMKPGDVVKIEIEKIGTLVNPVVAEQ